VVRCTVGRMLAVGPQTVDDLLAGIEAATYGRPIPLELPSRRALRAYLGDQPNGRTDPPRTARSYPLALVLTATAMSRSVSPG